MIDYKQLRPQPHINDPDFWHLMYERREAEANMLSEEVIRLELKLKLKEAIELTETKQMIKTLVVAAVSATLDTEGKQQLGERIDLSLLRKSNEIFVADLLRKFTLGPTNDDMLDMYVDALSELFPEAVIA